MPKTTKTSTARKEEPPSTLRCSPKKAQDTFAKAHDSAARQYGEGRRAHQTAYGALKHSFEKVGDHWEPKDQKGPSDEQSAKGGAGRRTRYPQRKELTPTRRRAIFRTWRSGLESRGVPT
jgi:cation transport regulator ChaB